MKDGQKPRLIGNSCLTIKTKKEMKKNLFMVAAVALMAFVSCSKEDFTSNDVQGEASDIVFSAEFEQPVDPSQIQSKTSLGAAVNNVSPVSWVKGDQIKVNGVTFTAASTGSRTNFETSSSFSAASTYYAVYPASATSNANHSAIKIPASQTGTFAEASISVAKSSTQSLSFKNVASIIKFQVPADAKEVTITSNNNIAGTVSVTFGTDGNPVIGSSVTNGSKTITLTGSFKASTDYYVAVLPGAHTFTMRIDGYLSKESTKAVTMSRAGIANLKTFPKPVASNYKIMGVGGDWTTGQVFYKEDVDCYVIKNVSLTATTEFKFCQEISSTNKVWGRPITLAEGKWAFTYDVDGNLKTTAGSYDIYVSAANDAVCVVKAGSAMPEYKSANKQLHLMLEKYEDCGLYMWQPSGTGLDNWDAAWNNYYGKVKMKQNATTWTEYYAFVVPSVAVDKQCKFLFKWYGGQSCDYTKTISTDLPFWRNGGNDGAYSFSSKINIQ